MEAVEEEGGAGEAWHCRSRLRRVCDLVCMVGVVTLVPRAARGEDVVSFLDACLDDWWVGMAFLWEDDDDGDDVHEGVCAWM